MSTRNIIRPDPVSWTTHHVHNCFTKTDLVISSGTGFSYRAGDEFFLITNWHNVSGKHPFTGKHLHDSLALPDILSTLFRERDDPARCQRESLRLYADEQMLEPIWFEHPEYGPKVDVVAIPINEDLSKKYQLFPINDVKFDDGVTPEIADDVFVVGYPFMDLTYVQMPVWKRGSIATEPDINLDQTPKLYIDTATRPGLSGSPVILQRIGVHGLGPDGQTTANTSFGRVRDFLGVYSGRIGKGELMAQLGIVWKSKVVADILEGRVAGQRP